MAEIDSLFHDDCFIEHSDIQRIVDSQGEIQRLSEKHMRSLLTRLGLSNHRDTDSCRRYLDTIGTLDEKVDEHNEELIQRLLPELRSIVNPVEGVDLDDHQLRAIGMDFRTRLVLAGAGTGKTTTIVGLVKHLIKSGRAKPESILLLSYTVASSTELGQRVSKEAGCRVKASTFHSFARSIISDHDGIAPRVSRMDIHEFVSSELTRNLKDVDYMSDYVLYQKYRRFSSIPTESDEDRSRYMESNPLVTLNGDRVKSHGESDIADYLFSHGIRYAYEDEYPVDTRTKEHSQYHPDFHILGTDVYIEYYGIDRSGNVARFMTEVDPDASEKYRESMEWKRKTHSENGTCLIELYSYQRSEGDLIPELTKALEKYGIQGNPELINDAYCKVSVGSDVVFNRMVNSLSSSIITLKSTGSGWKGYPTGKNPLEKHLLSIYSRLLKPVFDAYQESLKRSDSIDFEDMINRAVEITANGFRHGFSHVIVDEYQDISRSRLMLLRNLRSSSDFRLFCVGDDWQSIYRFSGSDVDYTISFERQWGPSGIFHVPVTHRFGGTLLNVSSGFIMSNPRQVRKTMESPEGRESSIRMIPCGRRGDISTNAFTMVSTLPEGTSVLFLGRYRHDVNLLQESGFSFKPDLKDGSVIVTHPLRPDLDIHYRTIHSSKGLQSDVVFILNNRSGSGGFPISADSNPLLSHLLETDEDVIDEERRLMYVALTRARNATNVMYEVSRPSVFVSELLSLSGQGCVCPSCGAELVVRKGSRGLFYGCTRYPDCRHMHGFE